MIPKFFVQVRKKGIMPVYLLLRQHGRKFRESRIKEKRIESTDKRYRGF